MEMGGNSQGKNPYVLHERAKHRATTLSLTYNILFTAIKLVVALLTGSMSLLSEALHSATDIVASAFAYIGVRVASIPPDERHPYGHGKPADWSLQQAHEVADRLEKRIESELAPAYIVIHVDPYDPTRASHLPAKSPEAGD